MNYLLNNKSSNVKKNPHKFQQFNGIINPDLVIDKPTPKSMPIKWVTLTFSNNTLIPNKNYCPGGNGGLRHNEEGYILQLQKTALYLNRKAILPPPWISLERTHNNGKNVSKNRKWSDYYDLNPLTHVDSNPPITFDLNAKVISNKSNKSIKYYRSNIDLDIIDKNIDVIVLVSYNCPDKNVCTFSGIPITGNFPSIKLDTSPIIKKEVDKLLINSTKEYVFLHIRRRDFLDNKVLAPPNGTRPYTDPIFIGNFIKKIKNSSNFIIIATDEKSNEYKEQLKKELSDKIIIFEEIFIQKLPEDIKNDNFMIYQIMHEIANRSKINIITHGLKLGNKYHYRLANG